MANQFLGLSLFIMLLSFFIILNTVSSFEDTKSRPVLNSLSLAFSNQEKRTELKPDVTKSEAEENNEGDTLEKLQAHFNAYITGAQIRKNRFGTMMHIRMPLEKFERAISMPALQGAASGSGFLPTLISLIQTRETEIPYRMDIVVNLENKPAFLQSKSPEIYNTNLKKAALFASSLESSGMQKKLMSVGLSKGSPGFVDIFFRRYEPFNPYNEEL